MHIVEKNDLMFGRRGIGARLLAASAMRVFGLNKINKIYNQAALATDNHTREILRQVGVTYDVTDKDLANILPSGGAVIVANHPTGALDGIVLIDAISKVRPDVRFMGNFLLDKLEYLSPYFIAVDPFDNPDAGRNLRGIKDALAHVKAGGVLVIFPAGEVATWQKGFSHVNDKAWGRSIMKFIRRCEVPVIPICIEAGNSTLFHLAGKIDPRLRTALLPHELINKRGKTVVVNIGSPLTTKRLAELVDIKTYSDYLRANVEYMNKRPRRRRIKIIPRLRKRPVNVGDQIISPTSLIALNEELQQIRDEHLLFEYANYEVYFAPPTVIPNMMNEIGRMREVTFREVGEGSMKSIDTDSFDLYYRQLFIWDSAVNALVGAYRMGMGDEIVDKYGLAGFYTNSLFKMSDQMIPIMRNTIELGRSFVTKEYQRKSVSLLLLWKGILYVLLKNERYRNLFGPVTISGEFHKISKTIIVKHLQQHHVNKQIASYIKPKVGLKGINAPIDASLIEGVSSMDLINKIVCDIERDELSIPILLKKYMQLNSHVLAFNVDHEFCDALDVLILVDLKKVPENVITMLSKEITEIDVLARFKMLS